MLSRRHLIAIAASLVFGVSAYAQEKSIVVASTTSTEDSGLFKHILPLFKAKTGIDVKVVAQGTGQALDTGRRGDADVVFVHAKSAEEKFLAEGAGVKRYPVMLQRLRPDRTEERSRQHQWRQGHRRGAQDHQGQRRAVHLSRRSLRHAHRRAQSLEGGRHRHREG